MTGQSTHFADRVAVLTPRQRECLRLVYEGLSSKEIASRLGLGPSTVDTHLKAATKALGISGRFEAARRMVEHERSASLALGTQSEPLFAASESVHPDATPQPGDGGGGPGQRLVLEDVTQAPQPLGWIGEPLQPRLSSKERSKDALSFKASLGQVVSVATLLAVLLVGAGAIIKEVGPAVADVRCYFKPSTCKAGR